MKKGDRVNNVSTPEAMSNREMKAEKWKTVNSTKEEGEKREEKGNKCTKIKKERQENKTEKRKKKDGSRKTSK